MMFKNLCFALAVAAVSAAPAMAASIGSLDSSRTYLSYQLDGGNYDDIRNAIINDGHSVTAGTGTVSAAYLAGLDVFYTGMLDTASTAPEIAALQSFVAAGGTLVIGADNTSVNSAGNYNSWFTPFGLSVTGNGASGGTWAASSDALLANGVAGTSLGFVAGTDFTAGAYTTLATDSDGDAAVVKIGYGSGWVVGLGDGNFNDDPASTQSQQFFRNIMAEADGPGEVPLPASLPLLGLGIVMIGLFKRRRSA
ncbi:hypothetical protein Ga0609869_001458 [Rhodovulum iodosum]|uniref:VPLPA-CTERM sorting domain-containing protein n=1 Tax=Rhodovulum iodosum TaxID=68291 RepID=A0ABV3XRZ7_9RHOB|nr:VPLPA-CTERM sorting domain-containing protein [Rhodovulum robiginosum]RSK30443.1 hypothetical protein EJA01_16810 [Rhodovulum robiginosum]